MNDELHKVASYFNERADEWDARAKAARKGRCCLLWA